MQFEVGTQLYDLRLVLTLLWLVGGTSGQPTSEQDTHERDGEAHSHLDRGVGQQLTQTPLLQYLCGVSAHVL